jgi:hypothetical protein
MPIHARHADAERRAVHPHLDEALRCATAIGALLVLLLPAARGSHAAIGWLPLWLLAMPLTAWWALHRFRLPGLGVERGGRAPARAAARRVPQARRRKRIPAAARVPHAA